MNLHKFPMKTGTRSLFHRKQQLFFSKKSSDFHTLFSRSAFRSLISIFFPFRNIEGNCHKGRHKFCRDKREPHSVYAEK